MAIALGVLLLVLGFVTRTEPEPGVRRAGRVLAEAEPS